MKNEVTKGLNSSITIKVTIPWKEVSEVKEKIIKEMVKNVILPGFRKGQAPEKLAREKLSKEKIDEETLRSILPDAYVKAVKENNLNPIISPRIHVEAFAEGTGLVFSAETCEEPEVDLKLYKEDIKKFTASSKIIIPGKEEKKPTVDEIISVLLKSTEVKLPDILVDQEVNKLLSQHLDEIKSLGLSLDQYLSSRNKNAEDLRKEYEEKAKNDLKIEFLLKKIADSENITVNQEDINQILSTVKDEAQKNELTKNPYVLAAIIRQQKTIDYLSKI